MTDYKGQTAELSNFLSKLLRDHFGKGPEGVFCSVADQYIVFFIKNLMSSTEKVLMRQGNEKIVQETRDIIMEDLISELKIKTLDVLNMNISYFFYDWNLHNRSAVIAGISSEETKSTLNIIEEYPGKNDIHKEIDHISQSVQKSPESLNSFFLNERTLLVIRNGILITIEKELIREGLEDKLKLVKRNLEKKHLHNNNHFANFLKTKIDDIFVSWDFENDMSVIIFIVKPPKGNGV